MALKAVVSALLLSLLLPLVGAGGSGASGGSSPEFGMDGTPSFAEYPLPSDLPSVDGAGEPTIGIPWNTDHVFFQAFTNTYRCAFDNATIAALSCDDVTPSFSRINLDPMLIADPITGRIFQGGLDGPCSVMGVSDDDGQTWLPSRNMCSGHQFDHQSIGTGPWSVVAAETPARNLVSTRSTYYCSQGELVSGILVGPSVTGPGAACATSLDGGFTWQPWTEVLGGCGSFHGHIRVSEVTGFATVPFARCTGGKAGYAYSADNGLTWSSASFPDSTEGKDLGFDPSIGFSYKSGWMYYALANDVGLHVALSKDDGRTWETIGNTTPGVTPSKWIDLAAAYTDPVTGNHLTFTTFTDVQAGDDDRAAITFMGTTAAGEKAFSDCDDKTKDLIWHYYIAQTFDGGQTWTITRMSEDPVQVGGIWDGGGGVACRNLLDFNDMDIDSHGRVVVGFADGCTGSCAKKYAAYANGTGPAPEPKDSRTAYGTLIRQSTGRGVFAKDDHQGGGMVTVTASQSATSDEKPVPAAPLALMLVALVGLALLGRKRLNT